MHRRRMRAGALTLAGKAVRAGQVIDVGDIGKLVFTPGAHEFGKGFASLKFQVIDDGRTANGGRNIDPGADSITFDAGDVTDVFRGASRADRITIGSSDQPRRLVMTSLPSMSGRPRSSTIRSGASVATAFSASAPVAASTTS